MMTLPPAFSEDGCSAANSGEPSLGIVNFNSHVSGDMTSDDEAIPPLENNDLVFTLRNRKFTSSCFRVLLCLACVGNVG